MDNFLIDSHKMHYHYDRIQQAKLDPLNTYPIYVEVSPIGICNHRCTFCAVDYLEYKSTKLPVKELMQFLKDAKQHGVKSVMFAGEGEPLLYKDLASVVCLCGQIGLDVALTTNGVALTEHFIKTCIHAIKWIKVSINAGLPRTYAAIHQTKESDFHTVWKNLAFACDFRDVGDFKCTIGAQTIILPENMDDIHDLAFDASFYGLDYLVMKPYSHNPKSKTEKYKELKYQDLESLQIVADAYTKSDFNVIFRKETTENYSKDKEYKTCLSVPYMWAYLMSTGDLYGCSAHILDDEFLYGNINQNSLKEIWTGSKRQKAIELMKTYDISVCRKNCRMEHVNRFLWDLENPNEHKNFI